jgi:large subunit ribosomal protein L6
MAEEIRKSRVGDKPIEKVKSVEFSYENNLLKVKGQKGKLELFIPSPFQLVIGQDTIAVEPVKREDVLIKKNKALHGTLRQLVSNMVQGVSSGFEKVLLLQGVGYRAQVSGNKLVLNLGFSLPVNYEVPETVSAKVDANKIILSSCDKQLLGQTAAEIRSYRPPEPYKGKGVHYEGERIIRKAGKTGKKD